ncbi:MAG: cytochrome P450 [Meiothermus sp.]|nr:cytochrome P450 [Meiothermus sp.]
MSEPTSIAADRKYDLYSQATKNDPYAVFARMRREDPVFSQLGLDGKVRIWFVTRYEDVQTVLHQDGLFVRDPRNALPADKVPQRSPTEELLFNHMLNKDGDEHRRLRTLVSQAFTPNRVRDLRPRVEAIARDLIAAVKPQGQMDLIGDYAFHLPTIVISEMLGIPSQDRENFKKWSEAVISPALTPEAQARAAQLVGEFVAYLRELFALRRSSPQDDLVSALLQAHQTGDQLSESELFSTTVLLIIAGHETTVNLIGNAVLALMRFPEARAALQQHPEQMAGALDEFLRYDSPVERSFSRWAARDTELGGQQIRRGDLVMGILGAANHDPEKFADPQTLDLSRNARRQLAFGHGMHYCLGAPLARLEGEIALNALLQNLPNLRLGVPEDQLTWRTQPMFRGLRHFPLVWDVV